MKVSGLNDHDLYCWCSFFWSGGEGGGFAVISYTAPCFSSPFQPLNLTLHGRCF